MGIPWFIGQSIDQQIMMTLHRLRSSCLAQRTATINTTRGVLREIGISIPAGASSVVPTVLGLIRDPESNFPSALRPVLKNTCTAISQLDVRIKTIEQQLAVLAKENDIALRLQSIPDIGLLTATAPVAFVGDIRKSRTPLLCVVAQFLIQCFISK